MRRTCTKDVITVSHSKASASMDYHEIPQEAKVPHFPIVFSPRATLLSILI